jgi:hypothetical protein
VGEQAVLKLPARFAPDDRRIAHDPRPHCRRTVPEESTLGYWGQTPMSSDNWATESDPFVKDAVTNSAEVCRDDAARAVRYSRSRSAGCDRVR